MQKMFPLWKEILVFFLGGEGPQKIDKLFGEGPEKMKIRLRRVQKKYLRFRSWIFCGGGQTLNKKF